MITWTQRVVAFILLPALITVLGAGCYSMRAMWRGQHYVLALFQIEDERGTVAGKLIAVTAPDGTTIKCRPSPIFTARGIVAVTPVTRGENITELRLTLNAENRMPLIALKETLRDGALAVTIDGSTCIAVCPITADTFQEEGIISLRGDWDPVIASQIIKYAETNHMLLHK